MRPVNYFKLFFFFCARHQIISYCFVLMSCVVKLKHSCHIQFGCFCLLNAITNIGASLFLFYIFVLTQLFTRLPNWHPFIVSSFFYPVSVRNCIFLITSYDLILAHFEQSLFNELSILCLLCSKCHSKFSFVFCIYVIRIFQIGNFCSAGVWNGSFCHCCQTCELFIRCFAVRWSHVHGDCFTFVFIAFNIFYFTYVPRYSHVRD